MPRFWGVANWRDYCQVGLWVGGWRNSRYKGPMPGDGWKGCTTILTSSSRWCWDMAVGVRQCRVGGLGADVWIPSSCSFMGGW